MPRASGRATARASPAPPTFDGNGPIIVAGKLMRRESTVGIVYTEDTNGA